MVEGKKTQTIRNASSPSSPNPATCNISHRNLRRSNLGGVIFGCTNATITECLSKQLFGLPAPHFSYVKNIDPGLPLFLFNYSDRKLNGIYEAASSGRMNINPYGWTTDGSQRTQYPAQVQIRVRLRCQPLLEEQFRPVIADNYYIRNHFWFELDHAQTSKLMSLLASLAFAPSTSIPQNTAKWRSIFRVLPSTDRKEEGVEVPVTEEARHSFHSTKKLDFTNVYSTDVASSLDKDNQPLETQLGAKVVEQDERDLILTKLKELALNRECQDLPLINYVEDSAVINDIHLEERGFPGVKVDSEEKNGGNYGEDSVVMNEIHLEVESETEIQRLKDRCMILESGSNLSIERADGVIESADEGVIESCDELHLDPTESIILVGGYDGESWLAALDSYFPTGDVIKSFRPMNAVRAYASVAKLNGELYVFGGGNGHLWYDTVESYNPTDDQWTLRPSLNEKKGSLAGATLNGKVFAIGGGNGVKCFSDVEMLDLDVGRWITTRSMLQKRFALAAAELNGVLYATGGYDGNDYLNSAERFDPREHSWAKIASMNTKRGCHSLVVLNEKLYALGGFDATTMIPKVEIYDPRLGAWTNGESMNLPRGYAAAAVVKESIYVIGGVIVGENILETVERYEEGKGWQEIKATSTGKRCFLSAIAL
ncbi:Kelch_1 domain-containing protein/Dev_Cell_Death domain-containing protein [Cephalotus follicularis]|uniref:Kelch_1 domain-containing protein/Dev_Cell_Death domain-containing protein n=1 Tax=Cephalotus follicularis TaxID=3775 RepID=A0A1Q3C9I5_CEPFO|nr:Kelch_1 domain-containing protein/Dev_Cell_Death domain-containing protein [Cephalotus follicularis]